MVAPDQALCQDAFDDRQSTSRSGSATTPEESAEPCLFAVESGARKELVPSPARLGRPHSAELSTGP